MKRFRTVKQAFENGYKIEYLDYSAIDQEWYIKMANKDRTEVFFFIKQLPKYLKIEMFRENEYNEIIYHNKTCNYKRINTKIEVLE